LPQWKDVLLILVERASVRMTNRGNDGKTLKKFKTTFLISLFPFLFCLNLVHKAQFWAKVKG